VDAVSTREVEGRRREREMGSSSFGVFFLRRSLSLILVSFRSPSKRARDSTYRADGACRDARILRERERKEPSGAA